jgi:hypothetical protein
LRRRQIRRLVVARCHRSSYRPVADGAPSPIPEVRGSRICAIAEPGRRGLAQGTANVRGRSSRRTANGSDTSMPTSRGFDPRRAP